MHSNESDQNIFINKIRIEGEVGKELSDLSFVAKDFTAVKDTPLTFGLKTSVVEKSQENSESISHFLRHGATLLGTTNLDPAALGYEGKNPYYGDIPHPIKPTESPLGSSGGAAYCVTKEICDFALTSDFVGSTRLPAAACNIYGFKLSPNILNRKGAILYHKTYDCFGLLTKKHETLKRALKVFSLEETQHTPKRLFIPHSKELEFVTKPILAKFRHVIQELKKNNYIITEISEPFFEILFNKKNILLTTHIIRTLENQNVALNQLGELGIALQEFSKKDLLENDTDYKSYNSKIIRILADAMFLTPSLPNIPQPNYQNLNLFHFLANFNGLPALTFPTKSIHLQIIGKEHSENQILELSKTIQKFLA